MGAKKDVLVWLAGNKKGSGGCGGGKGGGSTAASACYAALKLHH